MGNEQQGKTRVRIFTDQFMIIGDIAMFSDTRLTDFIVGAHSFIAVTDVSVSKLDGEVLFSAEFINLQRDRIVMVLPEDMVTQT